MVGGGGLARIEAMQERVLELEQQLTLGKEEMRRLQAELDMARDERGEVERQVAAHSHSNARARARALKHSYAWNAKRSGRGDGSRKPGTDFVCPGCRARA